MKILYVATISRTVHAFLVRHIEMLVQNGHQVDIACNMVTDRDDRLLRLGCRYFDLKFQRSPLSPKNISAYRKLKKLVRDEGYALVHTHTPVASACVRLACRNLSGVKVFYTAHGFHFYKGAPLLNWLVYYPMERFLSRYTDTLITINREDYKRAGESFSAGKVVLIPGVGIDTKKVTGSRIDVAAKKAALGIPEDDTVMLSVGELNKNKNHAAVIQAVSRLKRSDLTYIICGKGGEAHRLIKMVRRYRLMEKVKLLGFRTDVSELLQIADLFVHPSYREGLPVSLMEAMAAGLPCVVSDIRGNSDLIEDGKGGRRCRPDDIGGFASAIGGLLSDRQDATAMGQYNKEAIRRYDMQLVLPEIMKLYEEPGDTAAPDRKIKILHVSNSTQFSGAENVVCQIIRMFGGFGDIEMAYACIEGPIREALKERGVHYLPMDRLSLRELRRVVREYAPDIIHAHDVRATALAAFFCKPSTLVSTMHVNDVSMRSLSPKVVAFCLAAQRMRHIFWVSGSCYEQYYFRNRVARRSSVLINVIDRESLLTKMNTDPEEYHYDIVYLGRLTAQKDPLRLAEVLALAAAKMPGLRAAVIGSGDLEDSLKARLSALGIEENVRLMGFMSNPVKILHDSKAMVMTSVFEGTPIVALEAMALGVPIVSTPVDGMRELVIEDRTGYLSDDNDVLAERLVRIIGDRQLHDALSAGALERFMEISDVEAYKARLAEVYRG